MSSHQLINCSFPGALEGVCGLSWSFAKFSLSKMKAFQKMRLLKYEKGTEERGSDRFSRSQNCSLFFFFLAYQKITLVFNVAIPLRKLSGTRETIEDMDLSGARKWRPFILATKAHLERNREEKSYHVWLRRGDHNKPTTSDIFLDWLLLAADYRDSKIPPPRTNPDSQSVLSNMDMVSSHLPSRATEI